MTEKLIDQVRGVIVDFVGENDIKITDDENIMDKFQIDSLDCWQIMIELEDITGVEIPDDQAAQWKSIRELTEIVKKFTK